MKPVIGVQARAVQRGLDNFAIETQADRFLIIMIPNTPQQCLAVLDDMEAASPQLLAKTDWGCMAGDHTGYLIVTAASADAAMQMVPASELAQTKFIKLNKFTAEQIASFHKKKKM